VNEQELQHFEAELRGAAPAPLPEQFQARLQAAKPFRGSLRLTSPQPAFAESRWLWFWRRLAPGMAMAALGLLAFRVDLLPGSSGKKQALVVAAGFEADDVQVDEDLVSSFDVVATLPGGQPVRFRCRQWKDQLVATDKNHGVTIEQSKPRVEVVPVRFETY